MEGRLEHEFMTTKNIENNILVDLPQCVTDYYYSMGGLVKTKEDYLKKIRKFVHYVKTELGKEDICQVTMTEVDRYFDKEIKFKTVKTTDKNGNVEIKKVPTSYSHQKVTHTALNNFFEFLVEREYVLKNPVSPKKRPKRQKDEKKRTKNTYDKVCFMTNNMHNGAGSERAKNAQKEWMERDIAILVMFRDTGLRNTALSEINLSDIDFRNNKINRIIEKGAKRKEDGIIMSDDLRNALLVWTIKREKILKEKGVEEEALFISGKYRRLCEKSIRNIVKKYSKEYMGESISSHELRRVFCTTIYAETGDIELTRRLMGHEDVKTTQGYLGEMENPSQIASNIFNNISKRNIEVG